MRKNIFYFFVLALVILVGFSYFQIPYVGSLMSGIKATFSKIFEEKITPEDLHRKYDQGKIKILIVPGHDNMSTGAQFKNIKETDLNVELGQHLLEFFQKDSKFEVFITRDKWGTYESWFSDYLKREGSSISIFRDYVRSVTSFALGKGFIKREIKVQHNPAADNVSLNLYAINKWANDNDVDIVLHIHFNDYPTRNWRWPGKYSGFAIYVPEKQLPNSRASIALAESIKKQMEQYYPKSNFPGESDIIVETQELIAVGSNASRKGASLLVEYGYIYESQFVYSEPRFIVMKDLAAQTYLGVKEDFCGKGLVFKEGRHDTTLLPHIWNSSLKKGMKNSVDVLHLQMALLKEDVYPPIGKTLSSCPISGNFGNCTFSAVQAFQKKYGISSVGVVGPQTLEKLNELYGA